MAQSNSDALREALLRQTPDDAVKVDLRHALLHGGAIFGSAAGAAVVSPSGDYIATAGTPGAGRVAAARAAAHPEAEVLAYAENAGSLACALGGAVMALVHTLPAGLTPAAWPLGATESVQAGEEDRLAAFPERLRTEAASALKEFPAVAAMADGEIAAVCYAAAYTETLWDVSIETLEQHQRKGLAETAARRMIADMNKRGLKPVWGALANNAASLGLARKLGFRRVGELFLFA